MVLNLWKIGGKPTSYNPLTSATGNSVTIPLFQNYVLSFRAKSASNGSIRVSSWNSINDLNVDQVLTSDFKTYSFSWYESQGGSLFLYDKNASNDIIIDSIELVQKPLPKVTLNGVDGFTSGKWGGNYWFNYTVVDDSTVILNATGTGNNCYVVIPCTPNTTYTASIEVGTYGVFNSDASVSFTGYKTTPSTFTTGATDTSLRFYLNNYNSSAGQFTFKRPILNLGSVLAPYSRKTGDKMVLPVAKKNLWSSQDLTASTSGITVTKEGDWYRINCTNATSAIRYNADVSLLKNGKTYTVSIDVKNTGSSTRNLTLDFCDDGATTFTFLPNESKRVSISGTHSVYDSIYRFFDIQATQVSSDLIIQNVQLEEGTSATAYTPYAVQSSKKPQKWVPGSTGKNLASKLYDANSNGATATSTQLLSATTAKTIIEPVLPNTTYTVSKNIAGTRFRYYFYDSFPTPGGGLLSIGGSTADTNTSITFTTPSNATYVAVVIGLTDSFSWYQLEKGSSATSYEPYNPTVSPPTLPKARTGLVLNGISDYVYLPSATMDSIEIECLIDSVQPDTTPVIFQNSGGFGRISGANGGSISSITANGINYVTNQIMVSDQRVKIVYKFSSTITGDTNIFASLASNQHVKGTLYKVTCYLGGRVVVQYDFENPSNIVGTSVLQKATNLIPNFEDTRWNLHSNTQVLGKDTLRLNATASFQISKIQFNVLPNTTYMYYSDNQAKGSYCFASQYDQNGTMIGSDGSVFTTNSGIGRMVRTFTTSPTTAIIKISLQNDGVVIGTMEFSKPQLYALDGKEAAINGAPTQGNKSRKRTLYNKR